MNTENSTNIEQFSYDNRTVRNFAFATAIWGAVGTLVGLWIALELVFTPADPFNKL